MKCKTCKQYTTVTNCISCKDTICIFCIKDNISCQKCYRLFELECQVCEKTCHSDSYICPYLDCDFNCCKLCLMKKMEKSINDVVCPGCEEPLVLNDVVKILGKPWFENSFKKYKKETLYHLALLSKDMDKTKCKKCDGDECTQSSDLNKCKECGIFNTKTGEVYKKIELDELVTKYECINEKIKNCKELYEKLQLEKMKLEKYSDSIKLQAFKNMKAKLKCRELIYILGDVNDIAIYKNNQYSIISKINGRLEVMEKLYKCKIFKLELKGYELYVV